MEQLLNASLADFPTRDDRDLLRRSAAEDARAFDEFFHRHRDGLKGFLYRKLGSHDEADDAVALTFSNAWRARASFRGEASGKAWLYRIASRVALDLLRTRRRRQPEQELPASLPEAAMPSLFDYTEPVQFLIEAEREAEGRMAVTEAIQRLPSNHRELVTLYYFEGYNYEEISSILGISYGKVRGRLHLIRERIRRDLTDRQQWQPA